MGRKPHAVLGRCLTTQPNPFGDQAALPSWHHQYQWGKSAFTGRVLILLIASGFAGLSKPPDYLREVW